MKVIVPMLTNRYLLDEQLIQRINRRKMYLKAFIIINHLFHPSLENVTTDKLIPESTDQETVKLVLKKL